MHDHGIKVIVGTPTYAIPPWMAEMHPEVMVKTFDGQAKFGGRQNMDITNKDYLFYCERIIRKLMEHVREHPAVIFNGLRVKPFSENITYADVVKQVHRSLFEQNIRADFITPGDSNRFKNYKLLIFPPLYVATDATLEKVNQFIKDGGVVLMMFKGGFMDENSNVRPMEAPGLLMESCGFYYQEFYNIEKIPFKENSFDVDELYDYGHGFAELIIPTAAKPLVEHDHFFLEEYPAITINNHGKGTLIYEGCLLSGEMQQKVIALAMNKADIKRESIIKKAGFPLIIRSGKNQQGNTVHYIFNYSSVSFKQTITRECHELIEDKSYKKDDPINLLPWSVNILEE